ncbi:hypothetical protein QEH57_05835 [Pelagicoccus sp. SDUM812005]|nr:hypothetical protein [Pelagicoccus sp. SDUM812005]
MHAPQPTAAAGAFLAGICCFLAPAAPALDSLESSLEVLDSDLFTLSLLTLRAEQSAGSWYLDTTISRSDYELDFQPVSFDLLGQAVRIEESAHSLNLNASKQLEDNLTLKIGLGYRDGFSNYRALWLDTYFDQHFSPLEGIPGYELYHDAQVSASSLSAGLKWEYLPANGIATVTVSRIQDNVSPGYEIDFDGIRRGELVLASTSLSLVTENVLNKRMRARMALTATETSAREVRYSAELAFNTALGDRFVWRNKLGVATEKPQFDAYFFDTSLEYQISDPLALYLQARRYADTGEIENALLFTTAAPELDNDSLALGLRYTGQNWSAKLAFTHSHSDFQENNVNVDFFRNLYRDTDWLNLQLALAKRF